MRIIRLNTPKASKAARRKYVILVILLLVSASTIYGFVNNNTQKQAISAGDSEKRQEFNKNKHSTDQASSLWVVVNKGRKLPDNYQPKSLVIPEVFLRSLGDTQEMQLRSDAAQYLEKMFLGAQKKDLSLMLASGFRSYNYQAGLHAGYIESQGKLAAEKSSARAGHSEHQTGLVADIEPANRICEIEVCFGDTPEGKWLAINSYKYGFILRYPKDAEDLTGYEYEPWHFRFVGANLAKQITESRLTMEQFFGLPVFAGYPPNITTLLP